MADSETQPTTWFYQLLGLPTGPVSEERIQWLIEQQHLTAETMVGTSTNGPWVRLDQSDLRRLVPHAASSVATQSESKRPAGSIPRKKPRRSKIGVGAVTAGIQIDTDGTSVSAPERAVAEVRVPSTPVVEAARPESVDSTPRDPERPPAVEPATAVHADVAINPSPETQIGDGTDPEFEISLDEPTVPPQTVVSSPQLRATRTETQADAARGLRQAKKSKLKTDSGSSTGRQLLVPLKEALQRRPAASIGVGLALLAALGWLTGLFSGSVNTERAAETFERVMSEWEANGEMSDMEWAKWCTASREEVSAVLEPLRDHASADRPDVQNLMWAGDRLMLLLKGVRTAPPGVIARFEAYMAEYRGDPPEVLEPEGPGDQGNRAVVDPIF